MEMTERTPQLFFSQMATTVQRSYVRVSVCVCVWVCVSVGGQLYCRRIDV